MSATKGTEMRCPSTGDVVLYQLPDDVHPGLGIRTYPAIVLYPTNELTSHLDLLVLTGLDSPYAARWVAEGAGAGTWRPRHLS